MSLASCINICANTLTPALEVFAERGKELHAESRLQTTSGSWGWHHLDAIQQYVESNKLVGKPDGLLFLSS